VRPISLSCAAVLGLALTGSTAVAAEAPAVVVSTRVPYHDLDLSTSEGATVMAARISAASERLCGQINSPVLPRAAAEVYRCRGQTLTRAASLLDAPLLNARLQARAAEFAALK
jgi:UrcA family protein